MNFESIFLMPRELQTMESIRYGAVLRLHIVEAQYLLSAGFISPYALSERDDEYVVTPEGCRYMEYFDRLQAEKKSEQLQKEKEQAAQRKSERAGHILAWASMIVSNVIAFAALIVSIYSAAK